MTIADAGRGTLDVVRTLDRESLIPERLTVREPSLDDVFLSLTGHRAEEPATDERDTRSTTSGVRHDRDQRVIRIVRTRRARPSSRAVPRIGSRP